MARRHTRVRTVIRAEPRQCSRPLGDPRASSSPADRDLGPAPHRSAPACVRFHRVVMSAADLTCRDGVPVVSPARTLLNQAATSSRGRLEADINAADIHGLITPGALRRCLDGFCGQPGVTALRGLLDQHAFTLTHSELERLFVPVARSAGLPKPHTQAWVNGFRVDFFWPELGLVVETDGLRYHRTPAQQAKDLVRDQTHKAAGLEPLRFTHWQVAYDKRWVRATLCRVTERIRRS